MKLLIPFMFCCCCWTCFGQRAWNNTQQAEQYLDTLSNLLNQSQYREVQSDCELIIRHFSSFKSKKEQLVTAQAWSLKGNAALQSGNLTAALESHQRSLAIRTLLCGPRSLEVSFCFHNIGNCYLLAKQYGEAEKWLGKSSRIKSRFPEKKDGTTLESLGNVYFKTNRHARAKIYFTAALHAYGDDSPQAVNTLLSLASVFSEQGKYDTVLIYVNEARSVHQKQASPSAEKMAVILDRRGVCLTKLGQYSAATIDFQEALQLFYRLAQVKPVKLGTCLKNTGDCYLEIGDTETSAAYFQQAVSLFPANSFEMAGLLNSIGLLHYNRDEMVPAIDTFRRTVALLWDNSSPAYTQARASALTNLGSCLMSMNEWEGAAYYFRRAQRDFQSLGDRSRQMAAGSHLGFCLLEQGAIAEAERCFLKLIKSNPANQPANFSVWFHLGDLYERREMFAQARSAYLSALNCVSGTGPLADIPFPEECALAYSALAKLWYTTATEGGGIQALGYADAAIDLVESLKQLAQSEPGTVEIQNNLSEPCNIAVNICLRLGETDIRYKEAAFVRAGRYKSNFLRRMALRSLMQGAPLKEAEMQQVERDIVIIQRKRFEARRLGQSITTADEQALGALLRRQFDLKKEMSVKSPGFYQVAYQHTAPSVREIQQQLTSEEVLLEYQWTNEQIAIFVVKKDTFEVFTEIRIDSVAACVQRLWKYYSQSPVLIPSLQADSIHSRAVSAAHFLNETLLKSVTADTGKTLLIVPDNLLCYLPFEALIRLPGANPGKYWTHRYVNDDYAVLYAPSSGAFWQNHAKPAIEVTDFMAFAPVFHPGGSLDSLENNASEAREVAKITGGGLLEGADATKSAFLNQTLHCNVLHLATHGILNSHHPEFSFLAFSRSTDTTDYERFYVSEIYNAKIPVDLAVISACHSAGGKLYRGEGLISLAHAFMYAGARNVAASLWSVDDATSPLLMAGFYESISEGKGVPLALAVAKRNFLHSHHQKSHPYYWAGFVGWGNAGENAILISSTKNSQTYWWSAIILLVAVLILFFSAALRKPPKAYS